MCLGVGVEFEQTNKQTIKIYQNVPVKEKKLNTLNKYNH